MDDQSHWVDSLQVGSYDSILSFQSHRVDNLQVGSYDSILSFQSDQVDSLQVDIEASGRQSLDLAELQMKERTDLEVSVYHEAILWGAGADYCSLDFQKFDFSTLSSEYY